MPLISLGVFPSLLKEVDRFNVNANSVAVTVSTTGEYKFKTQCLCRSRENGSAQADISAHHCVLYGSSNSIPPFISYSHSATGSAVLIFSSHLTFKATMCRIQPSRCQKCRLWSLSIAESMPVSYSGLHTPSRGSLSILFDHLYEDVAAHPINKLSVPDDSYLGARPDPHPLLLHVLKYR